MRHFIMIGAFFFVGCAAQSSAVSPTARTPIVKVIWNAKVYEHTYLSKFPIEHAQPAHSKSTDQLVVVSSSGYVTTYKAGNGEEVWRKKFDDSFFAGAKTVSQTIYLGSLDGIVRALDLRSGDELWQKSLGISVEAVPGYHDGRIFISDINNGLHALDAKTGEVLWSHRRNPPSFFTIRGSCQPRIDKDAVYCGFSDGYLGAFQIDTGEVLWSVNLSDGQTEFTDITDEIYVSANRIYVASYGGGVYALNRVDGKVIWHNKVRGVGDMIESGDGIIVSTSSRKVAKIDKDNGEALWSFQFKKNAPIDILNIGDYLFVTTSSGPVYLFDVNTGYPFEKWTGSHGVSSPPVWGAERLYFFTDKGEVLAAKIGY